MAVKLKIFRLLKILTQFLKLKKLKGNQHQKQRVILMEVFLKKIFAISRAQM